jgi:hypothetical protein
MCCMKAPSDHGETMHSEDGVKSGRQGQVFLRGAPFSSPGVATRNFKTLYLRTKTRVLVVLQF